MLKSSPTADGQTAYHMPTCELVFSRRDGNAFHFQTAQGSDVCLTIEYETDCDAGAGEPIWDCRIDACGDENDAG